VGGWTGRQTGCLTGSLTNELSAYMLVNLSLSQSLTRTLCTSKGARVARSVYCLGHRFGNHGVDLQRGQRFFCFPKCADWLWGPWSLLFKGYPTHFMLVVKWAKCECHHVPPSTAEVKNEWIYTSNPAVCLHGVYRDNCTFIFTFSPFI
jgi:hypothetical protein